MNLRIGVPKEIKNNENRVALTPAGVQELVRNGHSVFVETEAGLGSGFKDSEYRNAGAAVVSSAREAWECDLVLKVKEPLPSEYKYFREGLMIFTYFHLAAEPELTEVLLKEKITAIAYETVQLPDNSLPLLTPMSEVAGRMAVQVGAQLLEKIRGGKGILLGGIPGVKRGKVTIIGGGVVGTNAAKLAVGLGAEVTIIDINPKRLRELDDIFGRSVTTLMSNPYNIAESVKESDLVIGAVLIPGAKAPKLVTEEMVEAMSPGSVIVTSPLIRADSETTDRMTTHEDPIYYKYGVIHYACPYARSSPEYRYDRLTNVTVPYVLKIANKGFHDAVLGDEALLKGVNTYQGHITHQAAMAHNLPYTPLKDLLNKP